MLSTACDQLKFVQLEFELMTEDRTAEWALCGCTVAAVAAPSAGGGVAHLRSQATGPDDSTHVKKAA